MSSHVEMCEINVAYLHSLVNSCRNGEGHIPGPPGNRLCSLPRNDWQYKTIHVLIGNCSGKGITKARSNENSSPRFLPPPPSPSPAVKLVPLTMCHFVKLLFDIRSAPLWTHQRPTFRPVPLRPSFPAPSNVDSDSRSKPRAYANYRRPKIYSTPR